MFSLPSLPTLQLPSFPSLPSLLSNPLSLNLNLPSSLQRRVLAFLLRRCLGGLVKGGEVDMEKVEADLDLGLGGSGKGKGKVEIRDVEMAVETLSNHLPPTLPLSLISGQIGLIRLTILSWSSLFPFSRSSGAAAEGSNESNQEGQEGNDQKTEEENGGGNEGILFEVDEVSLVFQLKPQTDSDPNDSKIPSDRRQSRSSGRRSSRGGKKPFSTGKRSMEPAFSTSGLSTSRSAIDDDDATIGDDDDERGEGDEDILTQSVTSVAEAFLHTRLSATDGISLRKSAKQMRMRQQEQLAGGTLASSVVSEGSTIGGYGGDGNSDAGSTTTTGQGFGVESSLFEEDLGLPGGFGGGGAGMRTAFGAGGRGPDGTDGVDEDEEVAEITLLAGLIERLLARVRVKVRKVRIRIVKYDEDEDEVGDGGMRKSSMMGQDDRKGKKPARDDPFEDPDAGEEETKGKRDPMAEVDDESRPGIRLELRVDEITYAEESDSALLSGGGASGQQQDSNSNIPISTKVLKISPPSIHMLSVPKTQPLVYRTTTMGSSMFQRSEGEGGAGAITPRTGSVSPILPSRGSGSGSRSPPSIPSSSNSPEIKSRDGGSVPNLNLSSRQGAPIPASSSFEDDDNGNSSSSSEFDDDDQMMQTMKSGIADLRESQFFGGSQQLGMAGSQTSVRSATLETSVPEIDQGGTEDDQGGEEFANPNSNSDSLPPEDSHDSYLTSLPPLPPSMQSSQISSASSNADTEIGVDTTESRLGGGGLASEYQSFYSTKSGKSASERLESMLAFNDRVDLGDEKKEDISVKASKLNLGTALEPELSRQEEEQGSKNERKDGQDGAPAARKTRAMEDQGIRSDWELLIHFGIEPIVARLSSYPARLPPTTNPNQPLDHQTTTALLPPQSNIMITVGNIVCLLTKEQMAPLVAMLSTVVYYDGPDGKIHKMQETSKQQHHHPSQTKRGHYQPQSQQERDAHQGRQLRPIKNQKRIFVTRGNCRGFHFTALYDSLLNNPSASSGTDEERTQILERFWSQPLSYTIPRNHLKLSLDHAQLGLQHPSPSPQYLATTRPGIEKFSFAVSDFSISEHTIITDRDGSKVMKTLPLILCDQNLFAGSQYDMPNRKQPFPNFDMGDWMKTTAGTTFISSPGRHETPTTPTTPTSPSAPLFPGTTSGPKGLAGFKVKPKSKRRAAEAAKGVHGQSHVPRVAGHSVALYVREWYGGHVGIEVMPLSIFADLSMVERLTPTLDLILNELEVGKEKATVDKNKKYYAADERMGTAADFHGGRRGEGGYESDGSEAGGGADTPRVKPRTFSAGVLEDLKGWGPRQPVGSKLVFSVSIPCLRVTLRCPGPPKENDELIPVWPPSLRAGIAALDIHSLNLSAFEDKDSKTERWRLDASWRQALAFFQLARSSTATCFLSLSPLVSDEDIGPGKDQFLLPKISLSPASGDSTDPPVITIAIPSVSANIPKTTLDGLLLLVDDLSLWSQRAFNEDTGDTGMIGSRFFLGKSFMQPAAQEASEESSTEDGDNGSPTARIKLKITEIAAQLQLPVQIATRVEFAASTPPPIVIRTLSANLSDTDLDLEFKRGGKNDMFLKLVAMDAALADVSVPTKPKALIQRTLPRNLATGSTPVIYVKLVSSTEPTTSLKESRIDVSLANLTYFFTSDLQWIEDIAAYGRSPEGAFETVVPNELTRIRFRCTDASLHLTPPTLTSRAVLSIEDLELKTSLMPDLPRTRYHLELGGIRALLVDEAEGSGSTSHDPSVESSRAFWKSRGFSEVLDLEAMDLTIRQGNGLVLPDVEVLIDDADLVVSACADSFISLGDFLTDISNMQPQAVPSPSRQRAKRLRAERSANLLASVEAQAFQNAPQYDELPDLLPDDIPTNLEYLKAVRENLTHPGKRGRSKKTRKGVDDETVISNVDNETIKMLNPAGLNIVPDWFTVPRNVGDEDAERPSASLVRVHAENFDVSIHLYEGYDWERTLKVLEEEAKATRKRLLKIRQLLASGQSSQELADERANLALDPEVFGLPASAADMDAAQLLAAIDEELREDTTAGSEATFPASSWQTLPEQHTRQPDPPQSRRRKRGPRPRARHNAIEANLYGLTFKYDTYPPGKETRNAFRLSIDSLEIIDNIRTSTWHKFLTELRTSDGGIVRASGSPMARAEMKTVKPPGSGEEVLFRLKLFPLRLHIDQDALDFIKAFFAFQLPGGVTRPPAPNKDARAPPPPAFLQRVEIWPIRIKMDYKPKRVDYAALRKGRAIELMNFFHFEGSEMVLRHITVNGVSGWPRLGEMLQDIWTPDVKANQLADFLSGIAPIRSVVNMGSGVADLVLLPIEQYKKDGRIVRGLQKGASSFAKTTGMEAIKLGAQLATGTQVILEQAESVLGAKFASRVTGEAVPSISDQTLLGLGPSDFGAGVGEEEDEIDPEIFEAVSRYARQPADVREGMQSAYKSLSGNFRSAAQTILAVPMEVYERSGSEGPVRAVVRAVPIAVLRPMIGASEAMSKALFGLRNTLNPEAQDEAADKYKKRVI